MRVGAARAGVAPVGRAIDSAGDWETTDPPT